MEDNKVLENGEIVIIYNTNVDNFLIPTAHGVVERCLDLEQGIYLVTADNGIKYQIAYPNPLNGTYAMFTRKEYIEALKKEKRILSKETRNVIAENNRLNDEKNKKLEEELKEGNNFIDRKINGVCSKYGHDGEWVLDRRKYNVEWNDWKCEWQTIYAPVWKRKCTICNRTEKVLLGPEEDPYDWHRSWPKSLIDYIDSLDEEKTK